MCVLSSDLLAVEWCGVGAGVGETRRVIVPCNSDVCVYIKKLFYVSAISEDYFIFSELIRTCVDLAKQCTSL